MIHRGRDSISYSSVAVMFTMYCYYITDYAPLHTIFLCAEQVLYEKPHRDVRPTT